MPLVDSAKSIRNVSALLKKRLEDRLKNRVSFPPGGGILRVDVGRPEPEETEKDDYKRRLNLFLYEALFDPSLKNFSLFEGQPTPLWLVLKYLMTAYDQDGKSDTPKAQEVMGEGIRALQDSNFLVLDGITNTDILDSLKDNPEPLKITFDETSSDLLSRIMQGTDEKYRFSLGFQVRPVMIASEQPSDLALLVGVDYSKEPDKTREDLGVKIPVLPATGPQLEKISPIKVEVDDTLTMMGTNLHLDGLEAYLGPARFTVTSQRPDRMICLVDRVLGEGRVISAGSHPVKVTETLPSGRKISSNLLVASLLPTLKEAKRKGTWLEATVDGTVIAYGEIELEGLLLGTEADSIILALFKDGQVIKQFDTCQSSADQKTLIQEIKDSDEIPKGIYRVILMVNGQQAKQSPDVELKAP